MAVESPKLRPLLPSLSLGAILVYMLNAVIARPGEWYTDRALMEACAMKVPVGEDIRDPATLDLEYEADEMEAIGDQQGLYFLCDIIRDDVHGAWRVPITRDRLALQPLFVLYHAAGLGDIEANFGTTGLRRKARQANPSRILNRRDHTSEVQFLNPDAIVPLGLDLAGLEISSAPALRLTGRDSALQNQGDDDDPDSIGPHTDLPALVNELVAQMALDIIQVSPNLKGRDDSCYISLSTEEQHTVTLNLYKSLSLPLKAVWFRLSDPVHWELQFDRFFPPYDKVLNKLQNFNACRYFQTWLRLRSQLARASFQALRSQLRVPFQELSWLPFTDTDRMWDTRAPTQNPRPWTYLNNGSIAQGRGVRIAINQRKHPKGGAKLAAQAAEEEEEEEEDDPRQAAPAPRPARAQGLEVRREHTPALNGAGQVGGSRQAGPSTITLGGIDWEVVRQAMRNGAEEYF